MPILVFQVTVGFGSQILIFSTPKDGISVKFFKMKILRIKFGKKNANILVPIITNEKLKNTCIGFPIWNTWDLW